ncbi:tetratricopeptide repeat protein [Hugenholtzia roseola]|uniref:tetratricopeptide repeat protein n=1 Tax=Hugenholtzia roseola TaxID=1002 RepID=UPI0004297C5E|nr:tetratricopeptide repeat protein [Hugenholtzia roseola]
MKNKIYLVLAVVLAFFFQRAFFSEAFAQNMDMTEEEMEVVLSFSSKGHAAYDKEDYQTAVMYYEKAIALQDPYADTYFFYALSKKALDDYQAAIQKFAFVVNKGDKLHGGIMRIDESLFWLADIYYHQKAYDKADLCLQKMGKEEEPNGEFLFYRMVEDPDMSWTFNVNPNYASLIIGNIWSKLNRHNEALAYFTKVIEAADNTVTRFDRAYSYLSVGKYQEAEADLTKVIETTEVDFVYLWRAEVRIKLGNCAAAAEDLAKAKSLLEPANTDRLEKLYQIQKSQCK